VRRDRCCRTKPSHASPSETWLQCDANRRYAAHARKFGDEERRWDEHDKIAVLYGVPAFREEVDESAARFPEKGGQAQETVGAAAHQRVHRLAVLDASEMRADRLQFQAEGFDERPVGLRAQSVTS
jgi:hypothetical protein